MVPALFHTQGGLVVDGSARVLRPDGTPIEGLYASGGAAAGISGHGAAGYLAGNGLLPALGLAFLAAEDVARYRPLGRSVRRDHPLTANRGGARMTRLNTLVKNVTVVRPDTGADGGEQLDIGITDGTFSRLEPNIPAEDADVVVDGRGLLAFPGVVDGHQHWGIYNSLEDDTDTESRASAQGGVTTGLTYMRTGQYYLNTGGPYRRVLPARCSPRRRAAPSSTTRFHLAPMSRQHIDEIPSIVTDLGVTSFKIFMFYGSHGLHGPRRTRARSS